MADTAATDDLAALVGSRICHDLVNPLGAIGNGAELLVMEDSRLGPLARLIGDSVESATARLRLYRLAFGPPSAERIGQPEIAATLAGYVAGRRLTVGWEAQGDRARADVRLAFLLILCAETALPRGGTITITGAGDAAGLEMRATGAVGGGGELRADPDLWLAIDPRGGRALPTLSPALVQFGLARAAIARRARPVRIALDAAAVTVGF